MSEQRENQASASAKQTDAAVGADATAAGPSATRRRMLKAGVAAAPMLLTLRGRPARAVQQPNQQSLGSLGVFYGAYVTQDMIDQGWFEQADQGKAVVPNENEFGGSKGKDKKSKDGSSEDTSPWKLDPRGNDRRE